MPVKLWSGLPGAGKTAAMVASILEFKEKNPDRPVFACNVNGLHESVAQPLTFEQLRSWWELPPGALICIDECQEEGLMPVDGGKPSEWVKRISKVRHEGMDFWLASQHPNLFSSYVRRLIDQHVHFVRKFNTSVVASYTWSRCMENCEKPAAHKVAVAGVATLPSRVFELYKSSNMHTMKKRVPLKAYVLPAALVVAVGALIAVPITLHRMRQAALGQAGGSSAVAKSSVQADRSVNDAMRRSDFGKWMRPRLDGIPWSAPAYDELQVRAVPNVFCIAVDDGRCKCVTEQGTNYAMASSRCRDIAANGLYNPFKVASSDSASGDEGPPPSGKPKARTAADIPSTVAAGGQSYPDRVTAVAYIPPEIAPRPSYSPSQLQ